MSRYDCSTGFVICERGRPVQAMRRISDPKVGNDDGVYWLRSLGEPIDGEMLAFLKANFNAELDREWNELGRYVRS